MRFLSRRKFYGTLDFDEFTSLADNLAELQFDLSAYPPARYTALCWNCRCTVSVGVVMSVENALKHRRVCGYENITGASRDIVIKRLEEAANV